MSPNENILDEMLNPALQELDPTHRPIPTPARAARVQTLLAGYDIAKVDEVIAWLTKLRDQMVDHR